MTTYFTKVDNTFITYDNDDPLTTINYNIYNFTDHYLVCNGDSKVVAVAKEIDNTSDYKYIKTSNQTYTAVKKFLENGGELYYTLNHKGLWCLWYKKLGMDYCFNIDAFPAIDWKIWQENAIRKLSNNF